VQQEDSRMKRLVTTTYLEMTGPDEFIPASPHAQTFELIRAEIPCPELNRFLYASVGARWWWYGRLAWDYARWLEYLDRPELETWVAYVVGTPAGYFELEKQDGAAVELAYFGLMPQFIGKGIGSALLSAAIARAWEASARRVWVHTCDLDHPRALANYQARGFRVFRIEKRMEELPDEALQPWPSANLSTRDPDS
jgi:GNAT superfamily N-acetyltransferase